MSEVVRPGLQQVRVVAGAGEQLLEHGDGTVGFFDHHPFVPGSAVWFTLDAFALESVADQPIAEALGRQTTIDRQLGDLAHPHSGDRAEDDQACRPQAFDEPTHLGVGGQRLCPRDVSCAVGAGDEGGVAGDGVLDTDPFDGAGQLMAVAGHGLDGLGMADACLLGELLGADPQQRVCRIPALSEAGVDLLVGGGR